jgi:hypothetical protein
MNVLAWGSAVLGACLVGWAIGWEEQRGAWGRLAQPPPPCCYTMSEHVGWLLRFCLVGSYPFTSIGCCGGVLHWLKAAIQAAAFIPFALAYESQPFCLDPFPLPPPPPCRRMHDYLVATGRSGAAALADAFK